MVPRLFLTILKWRYDLQWSVLHFFTFLHYEPLNFLKELPLITYNEISTELKSFQTYYSRQQ